MHKISYMAKHYEFKKKPFHSFGWNKGMPDNSAISWQKPMLLADTSKRRGVIRHTIFSITK